MRVKEALDLGHSPHHSTSGLKKDFVVFETKNNFVRWGDNASPLELAT